MIPMRNNRVRGVIAVSNAGKKQSSAADKLRRKAEQQLRKSKPAKAVADADAGQRAEQTLPSSEERFRALRGGDQPRDRADRRRIQHRDDQ